MSTGIRSHASQEAMPGLGQVADASAAVAVAADVGVATGEHAVQFFESSDYLDRSLGGYVAAGLLAGDTCIVVARPARRAALEKALADSGLEVSAAVAAGQLVLLDAADTLASLQVDGALHGRRFLDVVGALIERGGDRVRIYGEMVAVLWEMGRRSDAVRVEELWNELRSTHDFTLLCAYDMTRLGGHDSLAMVRRVCGVHSHVVPAETYSRSDEAQRLRSVVEWQHQAQLLQAQIAERAGVETALRAAKRELELQIEDLRRLHETSVLLSGSSDLDRVLQDVLSAALSVHGADIGLLSLFNGDRGGLVPRAHAGLSEDFLQDVACIPYGAGACGTSYAERRRVIVEDTESDPVFVGLRGSARAAGFRACHSTPLIGRSGRIIGVLTVHFRMRRRATEREMRLMDLYARSTADTIENAQRHQQARHELDERMQLLLREQHAREEAEQANRLKDEFLATVSHELRTPLTTILGWAHMLRHDDLDARTAERAIETIERAATTQAQLVEDILDVSRIITGRLRLTVAPVDVAAVIEAAVASLRLAAESKGVQLRPALEKGAARVHGDAARLQQVVWNLVSNAIKFTPGGGRVDVRMDMDGPSVRIEVSDSGEGFDPEFAPFLFDRFRQADGSSSRRHGGLGLGLAIVRHLVEMHGGTVAAESAGRCRGARFLIRLPLSQRLPAEGEALRRTEEPPPPCATGTVAEVEPGPALQGVRLLVVDNDRDTLDTLGQILKEQGATVRTATTAAEAFEVLQWYVPAVLISDLALPGEDGYRFISRLRAREARARKLIPAVALTAQPRIEDRRRALTAGFNMFIPKPIEPTELITTIATLAAAHR